MSEADAIARSPHPFTVETLSADLKNLGIKPGMTLLVHSSLSSIGFVCGGAVAVILALESVLGDSGTLVMPAFTGHYSDPAYWHHPPVPEDWWQTIRDEMPAFDPLLTPTRGIGDIPEAFRKQIRTIRSSHPQVSFAARGPKAVELVADHPLDYALGDRGPLGRIYDSNGYVLLLGVGYGNNTSLHLAEYRASYPGKRVERSGAPIMENGRRFWKELEDFGDDSDDFENIGAEFEAEHPEQVKIGRVGMAEARLMLQRNAVDFAVGWMNNNRS